MQEDVEETKAMVEEAHQEALVTQAKIQEAANKVGVSRIRAFCDL